MDADDSVIEPDWRRFVDPAIVLELIPIIALVSAYGLAALVELLTNGQARGSQLVPAFVLALGFFVSGLGWFRVGEPGWGWTMLAGRIVILVVGVMMGLWVFGSALAAGLCETSECRAGDRPSLIGLTPGFLWATAAVWIVALLSPLASAVALALWMRRNPTTWR